METPVSDLSPTSKVLIRRPARSGRSAPSRHPKPSSSIIPAIEALVPPLVPTWKAKYPTSTWVASAPAFSRASAPARLPGTKSKPKALSIAVPWPAAIGPHRSNTSRMNVPSPVESR